MVTREVLASIPGLAVRENEPLGPRTTLRIGGLARFFCAAQTVRALSLFLERTAGSPVLILGKGSNILIPDEGFDGAVLVLAGEFLKIEITGPRLVAGGGAGLMSTAVKARNAGLCGLENLSGIPSTVGGAVRINAGAYGAEIFDVLDVVETMTREGVAFREDAASIPHAYRWSALMERGVLVTKAVFRLEARDPLELERRFLEVTEKRKNALPQEPNAGSVFKNPPGQFAGRLLEQCGLKGARVGGAEVSPRHANVIVNRGGARAQDVRELMRLMRSRAEEKFGVTLVPEIELIGGPL